MIQVTLCLEANVRVRERLTQFLMHLRVVGVRLEDVLDEGVIGVLKQKILKIKSLLAPNATFCASMMAKRAKEASCSTSMLQAFRRHASKTGATSGCRSCSAGEYLSIDSCCWRVASTASVTN